jgi:hypothetical protein
VLKLALETRRPVDVAAVSDQLGFSAIQAESELRELADRGFLRETGAGFALAQGREHDAREAAILQEAQ